MIGPASKHRRKLPPLDMVRRETARMRKAADEEGVIHMTPDTYRTLARTIDELANEVERLTEPKVTDILHFEE